jgi:hypothetical protein
MKTYKEFISEGYDVIASNVVKYFQKEFQMDQKGGNGEILLMNSDDLIVVRDTFNGTEGAVKLKKMIKDWTTPDGRFASHVKEKFRSVPVLVKSGGDQSGTIYGKKTDSGVNWISFKLKHLEVK